MPLDSGRNEIDIPGMMKIVKNHPDFNKAGMVLCHNGVVRDSSFKSPGTVLNLIVKVDHEKLSEIIAKYKKRDGIIEIFVKITENKTLYVGDDIMCIIVAGDERKNVIKTLSEVLDEVKSEATSKTENFV